MRTAGWPLPSVVAGSLRTAIAKAAKREFSAATAQDLLEVAVGGVLPVADGKLYLPAPRDCVVQPEQGPLRVTPQMVNDGGCDWPTDGLRPVMLSEDQAPEDFKLKEGPAWWPLDRYTDWLTEKSVTFDRAFLHSATKEERTHVQLDADTGSADEGNLFTTVALPLMYLERYDTKPDAAFGDRCSPITLAARVTANGWCDETVARLNTLHPLGGERRLVHWKATTTNPWTCHQTVSDALAGKECVRMFLATPAIFRDGWKPGWLNDQLTGTPPGSNVTLKLVGVNIERWRAVSGWSLADLPGQPRGPKPVKRIVPAGGVYFFEVINGSAAALTMGWLEPMSDDEQDRRDGFGLAVWGTW
jgi:CRISPR-associated protein Cmr3